jgi:golgin subfamily A protein 1
LDAEKSESHRTARDKDSRIFALEEEVKVLKTKLAEDFDHIESLKTKIDDIEHDCKEHQLKERAHQQVLASNKDELAKLEAEIADLKETLWSERDENNSLKSAHQAALTDAAGIRDERDRVTEKLRSLDQSRANLLQEIDSLRNEIKEGEDTFPTRVENSLLVQDLRRKLREAEDELIEKKKAIKLHQQRMTDLKKTFQKEMRSSVSNTDLHGFPVSHFDGKAQSNGGADYHEEGASQSGKASPLFAPSQSGLVETSGPTVNFKYLKHVIFKFLTSREYEVRHSKRVLKMDALS